MPSYRKKSPATKGKRKTRASDKARTTPRKNKKSKPASINDGSYLQLEVQQQPTVSTVTSNPQSAISASTGQAILEMLNKLDASNQELSKRLDRFERNSSISSTSLTSPTIPPVGHHRVNVQYSLVATQPAQRSIPGRLVSMPTDRHGIATDHNRQLASNNEARDAIAPKVDTLRSIPISIAISQLLANYEQQSDRDILQGKITVIRKKSGRYNTTDTTSMSPKLRWPNEGLVSASHLKKPAYDDLSLAQWASGQLANILLVEDQALSRSMLVQMAAAMRDDVSLPWPVVRSAWAVSMTDIEEGRLGWTNSMQWSLNRISNSQLAMHNTQSVVTSAPNVRICHYFNEGTCTSEGHHGTYKHFCAHCYKQGRSLGNPEVKCFNRSSTVNQEHRPSTGK